MEVGVFLPDLGRAAPREIGSVATEAERLGYQSVWCTSHTAIPAAFSSRYPYSRDGRPDFDARSPRGDALDVLAFVSAFTSRIRLGTCVIPVITTDPLTLAHRAATVDVLSGGRLELGVGAGWLREEATALGRPPDHPAGRLAETIEILRMAWTQPTLEHHGAHYDFPEVGVHPHPLQGGNLPIWVGGSSVRAMETAAEHSAGFFLWRPRPEDVAEFARSLRLRNPACRVAASLALKQSRAVEQALELAEAGADLIAVTGVARESALLESFVAEVTRRLN